MYTAAILTGGRARRFGGRDKSALVVGGRTILDRQVAELSLVAEQVLLVGGRASHPAARAVADVVPGCGPLGGLHTALLEARGAAVFLLACDMPCVSAPFVSFMLGLTTQADIVVPRTEGGYHPVCAAYTRACLEPVARRLAERRLALNALFTEVRVRVVTPEEIDRFGDRCRLLANVNTPADYAGLETLHGYQL